MSETTATNDAAGSRLRFAQLLLGEPGTVVELRALDVPRQYGAPCIVSGYFDDVTALANAAADLDRRDACGVYVTMNPVLPALLARAANRVVEKPKQTTSDTDIGRRLRLLIDIDAVRPTGISSTDEERTHAIKFAETIATHLEGRGWPAAFATASGNGAHLLYGIDLPADDGGLVARVLQALAFLYNDDRASIDLKVFNPARITRFPGTTARKGDSTSDRPHRLACILHDPGGQLVPVPVDLLEALAAELPVDSQAQHQPPTPARHRGRPGQPFDVGDFLTRHSVAVRREVPWNGGRKWVLEVCPWDSAHTDGSAWVAQFPSGAVAAGCQHNGCAGRKWRDLRDHFEPVVAHDVRSNGTSGTAGPIDPERKTELDRRFTEADRGIIVETDIASVVDAAEAALIAAFPGGSPDAIYQRANTLVMVRRGLRPKGGKVARPQGAPIAVIAKAARLRELMRRAVPWSEIKETQYGIKEKPCLPPEWAAKTLLERPDWRLPELSAIAEVPILRDDGSIFAPAAGGYDPDTAILFEPLGATFPPIPENPTRDDAREALGVLHDPLCDFRFTDGYGRDVAVAAILTLIARHIIHGPVPLIHFGATVRGAGKGLLVDVVSLIGTGRTVATLSPTLDDREIRKELLSIAMAGDAMVSIDNIEGAFGSAALASALTSDRIQGRVLGVSRMASCRMTTLFVSTGNGVSWVRDLGRRVVPCEQDPGTENPEDRTGFRYDPLRAHVRANRGELVAAALTLLRAHAIAGRPSHGKAKMGSFEEWDDVVRSPIIWAEGEDPLTGREKLREEGDQDRTDLRVVLDAWRRAWHGTAATVRQAVDRAIACRAAQGRDEHPPELDILLADALRVICPTGDLDARKIGEWFRRHRGRIVGGQRLVTDGETGGVARWKVEDT